MIVLGLDQATTTGYSIFDNDKLITYGLIKTNNKLPYVERIAYIKQEINKIINEYNVEFIELEDVQQQKSPDTHKKLSQLLGVLENNVYEKQFLYDIVQPEKWRSAFGIKGRNREQKKRNTVTYVKKIFNIDVSEDEADAIVIGWYACKKIIPKIKIGEF